MPFPERRAWQFPYLLEHSAAGAAAALPIGSGGPCFPVPSPGAVPRYLAACPAPVPDGARLHRCLCPESLPRRQGHDRWLFLAGPVYMRPAVPPFCPPPAQIHGAYSVPAAARPLSLAAGPDFPAGSPPSSGQE